MDERTWTFESTSHSRKKSADTERLIRWITGKTFGLVLGSSWSKTAAQIGILQAFHDANLPIDAIGGVGLSALIAALYASGKSPREILHILRPIYQNIGDLLDYTFPFLSLVKGKRIQKILDDLFQQLRIEHLWLPFFCVASDLRTTHQYLYRFGKVSKAIRASFSTPGIFPPVCDDELLLAHGSLSNLLPLDVMERFTEGGRICAVDMDSESEWATPEKFEPTISGWRCLLKKWLPFGQIKAPNILQILLRTTLLCSTEKKERIVRELKPDFFLRPPLDKFSETDFSSFDSMYEIGYSYAREQIRQKIVKEYSDLK